MKKRLLAIITAVALVLAMMPAMALAEEGDISVKVTIKNNNFVKPLFNDEGKRIYPAWTGEDVKDYEVTLAKGETAQDAIERACKSNGIAYVVSTDWGSAFFMNFDGLKNGKAGILTDTWGSGSYYDMSGWMFLLNGSMPGYNATSDMINDPNAPADKQLKAGDDITMAYAVDGLEASADKAFAQGVKLNKTKVTLNKGESVMLTADITPSYGQVAKDGVVWGSSDASVAKVDAGGKVTAVSAGIATIKATAKNTLNDSAIVTIAPQKTTITKAKGKKKAVLLKWNKQADSTGYVIYRAAKKNGQYMAVKTISKNSVTTWTNKNLKKNKKYFYKIKVFKASKGGRVESPFSPAAAAKTKK